MAIEFSISYMKAIIFLVYKYKFAPSSSTQTARKYCGQKSWKYHKAVAEALLLKGDDHFPPEYAGYVISDISMAMSTSKRQM